MIKPTGANVLLKEIPSKSQTQGGITLPDIAQHILPEYSVIAVGPKCDESLQPGCRAVLDQFRCQAKTEAGPGLWIVQESSISIVIPPTYENRRPAQT